MPDKFQHSLRLSILLITTLLCSCASSDTAPDSDDGSTERHHDEILVHGEDLREPTQEEIDDHWESVVMNFSDSEREVPEDLEVIRWVSLDEFGYVLADCFTEAGFPTEGLPDGGWRTYADLTENSDQYSLAFITCLAKYPVHPASEWDRTSGEYLAAAYDYLVNALIPCLIDEGYPQPDPPSFDVFTERMRAEPYLIDFVDFPDAIEIPWEDVLDLELTCPVNFVPPAEIRNG